VNGVTLPFKITATFNGQPWKEQSATIESITINGKIEPAFFERPKQKLTVTFSGGIKRTPQEIIDTV
ncbi:MAG: hypothetical protein M3R68_09110, partial [Acidobacteriota bacterium]|nr:hypothetical protein [Acidobacteriota bacterium]